MDTFLTIATKRDQRTYATRAVPDEVVALILDAGRLAGSARNRQPWRFLVLGGDAAERAAASTFRPANVTGAPLAIVLAVREGGSRMAGFDAGRAAQNMMLAAWGAGVTSCPNGIADPAALAVALGLPEDETPVTILSFGYPVPPRHPERREAAEWSRRANRLPLEDVAVRVP